MLFLTPAVKFCILTHSIKDVSAWQDLKMVKKIDINDFIEANGLHQTVRLYVAVDGELIHYQPRLGVEFQRRIAA